MITKDMIEVKPLKVRLSAKTDKCEYMQTYNLSDRTKADYIPDLETAKERFIDFYNRFE